METKDLIIGAIIGGIFVWLWTRQQNQQLNQLNQLRNYTNDEICIVERNREGFITQLRIKRDAHVNQ